MNRKHFIHYGREFISQWRDGMFCRNPFPQWLKVPEKLFNLLEIIPEYAYSGSCPHLDTQIISWKQQIRFGMTTHELSQQLDAAPRIPSLALPHWICRMLFLKLALVRIFFLLSQIFVTVPLNTKSAFILPTLHWIVYHELLISLQLVQMLSYRQINISTN